MIHATHGTANGPACACGSTVYGYAIDDSNDSITAQCIGCHRVEHWRQPTHLHEAIAIEIRREHDRFRARKKLTQALTSL